MLEMSQKECKEKVQSHIQLLACKIEFSKTIGLKTRPFTVIENFLNGSRYCQINQGLTLLGPDPSGLLLGGESTLLKRGVRS